MYDVDSMAQKHNDFLLNKYLAETNKNPFRPCDYCGGNLFDFDDYYDVGGDIVCERCCKRKSTDDLEVTEWR